MLPYALTVLLSAFLLFQVEPLIARMMLPWFGGSAAVWTTCMLFFQVVLLLGYLYTHWCVQHLRPRVQRLTHALFLMVSLLALPIALKESWKPSGTEEPALRILGLLAAAVGLPFFLLSATGPLLQAWYITGGRSERAGGSFPYRLYAVSNFGSMLALLSYPVIVEPHFSLRQQSLGWSWGYGAFVFLCGAVALRSPRKPSTAMRKETAGGRSDAGDRPGWPQYGLWIALAACASTLLLAVTNHLTQNVASIPFLWIVPLSLYLLSFILCFGGGRWEWQPYYPLWAAVAIGAMSYELSLDVEHTSLKLAIPLFAIGLFLCCMLCHGELARTKPDPQYLTSFYVMVSLGGALGGVFVGLIAPRVFSGYTELPLSLTACALVISLILLQRPSRWPWNPLGLISVGLTLGLGVYFILAHRQEKKDFRLTVRNFYGVLRVSDPDDPADPDATRTLNNGTIIHGQQFVAPKRQMHPTTYYGRDSGVGLAIAAGQARGPERVAVIGLGAGTLACYGRAGDLYRFYEINPLVLQVANTQFSFLRGCKATVEVVLGDARLSLEREPDQKLDVLAVDAFSGDAIPMHLLTQEAFAVYFRHLKPSGVLAVHVSNRYVDLEPVVAAAARSLGKEAMVVDSEEDDAEDTFAASWVLVGGKNSLLQADTIQDAGEPLKPRRAIRAWTDDYSSLWRILQ